jgi:4-diphosphocytidyl-2-C-methyl-D-erythritol kinase
MITFPNAKINLGLHVLDRREDGFHNIESVIVPVSLCDSLEVVPDYKVASGHCSMEVYGLKVQGGLSENLCCRAYSQLAEQYSLPAVNIRLLKNIPTGAGLGGGSADAAFTIKMLNDLFGLKMTTELMEGHCAELGSDCSFFIGNATALTSGRGEMVDAFNSDMLVGYQVVVVHPGLHIDTGEAYSNITPDASKRGQLMNILANPMGQWKDTLVNDFEAVVFTQYPQLQSIKEKLYDNGAVYASLSGSGSSLYGLFKDTMLQDLQFGEYQVWSGAIG